MAAEETERSPSKLTNDEQIAIFSACMALAGILQIAALRNIRGAPTTQKDNNDFTAAYERLWKALEV